MKHTHHEDRIWHKATEESSKAVFAINATNRSIEVLVGTGLDDASDRAILEAGIHDTVRNQPERMSQHYSITKQNKVCNSIKAAEVAK